MLQKSFFCLSVLLVSKSLHASPDLSSKIEKKVGETFEISLPSNHTTGYGWYLQVNESQENSPVKLIKKEYITNPHPEGMVGVGGTEKFIFKALKEGAVPLALAYKRIWEKNSDADYKLLDVLVHPKQEGPNELTKFVGETFDIILPADDSNKYDWYLQKNKSDDDQKIILVKKTLVTGPKKGDRSVILTFKAVTPGQEPLFLVKKILRQENSDQELKRYNITVETK